MRASLERRRVSHPRLYPEPGFWDDGRRLSAGVSKRSVMIAGHRTSVSLEDPFWVALRAIASGRSESVQALIGAIDAGRGAQNLSSAIRIYVLTQALAGVIGET